VIDAFIDTCGAAVAGTVRYLREPADLGDCLAVVLSIAVISAYIGGLLP
jgi:hypothetical protein